MTSYMLTEVQKEKFQQRLSGVLRSLRYRKEWKAKDVANRLGLDPSRYSKLEHPSIPYPKFITALEFLLSISQLEKGVTLTKLVDRLESDPRNKEVRLTTKEQEIIMAIRGLNEEEVESVSRMLTLFSKRAKK